MVICLERGADLHMAQLMPLPLTVSCSSKIQIGFSFLVLAHLGSPRQRAVKRVCVCMLKLLKSILLDRAYQCLVNGDSGLCRKVTYKFHIELKLMALHATPSQSQKSLSMSVKKLNPSKSILNIQNNIPTCLM